MRRTTRFGYSPRQLTSKRQLYIEATFSYRGISCDRAKLQVEMTPSTPRAIDQVGDPTDCQRPLSSQLLTSSPFFQTRKR